MLSQISVNNRNIYYLAMKLNKSTTTIYSNLKILEAGEYVTKIKSPSIGTIFNATEEGVIEALKIIRGENEISE